MSIRRHSAHKRTGTPAGSSTTAARLCECALGRQARDSPHTPHSAPLSHTDLDTALGKAGTDDENGRASRQRASGRPNGRDFHCIYARGEPTEGAQRHHGHQHTHARLAPTQTQRHDKGVVITQRGSRGAATKATTGPPVPGCSPSRRSRLGQSSGEGTCVRELGPWCFGGRSWACCSSSAPSLLKPRTQPTRCSLQTAPTSRCRRFPGATPPERLRVRRAKGIFGVYASSAPLLLALGPAVTERSPLSLTVRL